jgi:hypothetical protein
MKFPSLFDIDENSSHEKIVMVGIEENYHNLITELSGKHERIAKAIELMWGTRECENYLSSLVLADRHDRQGFSKEAFTVILKLGIIHSDIVGPEESKDRWVGHAV